eukprot:6085974-Ditylum_brightwellii.AAC.2
MEPSDTLISKKITKDQWRGKVTKWHESTTTSPSGRHSRRFKALICMFKEAPETKWHESTTTSPSGRHLRHFKALICMFKKAPETDKGREMYKKEDIIDAHIGLLNYAVEQRCS